MKRPLLTVLGLFLLGELTGQWIDKNIWYSGGAALAATGIVIRSNRMFAALKNRNNLLLLFCCFVVFSLGAFVAYAVGKQNVAKETPLMGCAEYGESICLEGTVTEVKETSWILESDVGRILVYPEKDASWFFEGNTESESDHSGEKSSWDANRTLESETLQVGDRVRIAGTPEPVPKATDPGAFDSAEYYESEGIRWQIRAEEEQLLGKQDSWSISFLSGIRESCREHVYALLPEKEAGVLTAMLLGERSGVDRELKELYRQSGIAHILAISGLHVSLIGVALMWLLRFLHLSRRKASILTILLLLLYGALTGFSPATLRAVIMLSAVNLGGALQRTADPATSMGTSLFLILMIQPYRITSTGMLMSFLAVFGVLASGEMYRVIFGKERFLFLPLRFRSGFKKLLHAGLFAAMLQCFMQPLLLREYFAVSPYAPLLNLIVIPLLTVAVACGALGVLISFLPGFQPVAEVCVLPCRWILQFYEWLCRCMLQVPGHEVITGHITTSEMLLFLGLAAVMVWILFSFIRSRKSSGRKWRYYAITLASAAALLVGGALYAALKNRMVGRIIFLDVGQGDGCIVHTSDGTNLLFDCGSSSKTEVGFGVLIPALRYYGIDCVDAAFISHTDTDHVNGVLQLLEQGDLSGIEIRRIVLGKGTMEDDNLQKLRELTDAEFLYLTQGETVTCGSAEVTVLLPAPGEEGEGNDYSMVDLLTVGDCTVLFTGDIGQEREEELVEVLRDPTAYNLPASLMAEPPDILKVAHHGSKYSSGEEFLRIWGEASSGEDSSDDPYGLDGSSDPNGTDGTDDKAGTSGNRVAVISCGRRNMYGHPAPATLDRLREAGFTIYRTDQNGAVIVDLP
ncbi:MAG: DNA internalization-related competence protein ComEC/Rec2 [Eubacterium sp.]|nr:DNA internalization-related competence protein ComEC/Rec2 [Eubacterium sp.]